MWFLLFSKREYAPQSPVRLSYFFSLQLSLKCSLTNVTARRKPKLCSKPQNDEYRRRWCRRWENKTLNKRQLETFFFPFSSIDYNDHPPVCTKKLKLGILIFVCFAIFYVIIIVFLLFRDWNTDYWKIFIRIIRQKHA